MRNTQRPIIAVGVAIMMVAAQMLSPPAWLSLPLMAIGVMFVMWGFAREQMNAALSKIPFGWLLIQGFERFESTLEDEVSDKRRRLVDQAFSKLTPEDIQ